MSSKKKGFTPPSMTTQIVIAVVLGVLAGLFLPNFVNSIAFLGDIFLRLIQMGIVLLVLGQIVAAIGNLEIREFGRIGLGAVITFAISSIAASPGEFSLGSYFSQALGFQQLGLKT